VLIRVNTAGLRALRQLALDEDRTLQALGIEAFNDLLRKHGSKPVVAEPAPPSRLTSAPKLAADFPLRARERAARPTYRCRARRRGVQSRAQAYVFNVFGWVAEAARG
jgi:hypothetical protein